MNGAGEWSEDSLITAATIPSAPAVPKYASSTSTTIVLSLSRSLDDGGIGITDYELEMDQGVPSDPLTEALTSSFATVADYVYATHGFTYTVDSTTLSLTPGQLYRFRFRAKNLMGYSSYSDTIRIGLGALPDSPATGPTRVTVAPDGGPDWNTKSSIGLEWPEVTTGDLSVYEYVLYVDDGFRENIREAYRGPLTIAKVENLEPGLQY